MKYTQIKNKKDKRMVKAPILEDQISNLDLRNNPRKEPFQHSKCHGLVYLPPLDVHDGDPK